MSRLQTYTGLKAGLLNSAEEYTEIACTVGETDDSFFLELQNIIFNNPTPYIDGLIQNNQETLSPEEVEILHSWKLAVKGTFFVERHLKDYSVFIEATEAKEKAVYAVLGLDEPLKDLFPARATPVMVDTVLLPFKNRIVAGGLFHMRDALFGNRTVIKELDNIYRTAKYRNKIIHDLQQPLASKDITHEITVLEQPWKAEITQIVALTKKLRGGRGQSKLNSVMFSFLKASAEFVERAVREPEDVNALEQSYSRLTRLFYELEDTVHLHVSDKY
jgi:hypothetical protein